MVGINFGQGACQVYICFLASLPSVSVCVATPAASCGLRHLIRQSDFHTDARKKTYHFTVTATHMSVLVCECLRLCGHVADRKQAQWQLMLSAFNLTQRPCCKFTAIMQSSCQLRLRQLAACVSLSQSIRPASSSKLPFPVGGPKNLLPFCSYNVSISRVLCVCVCVCGCVCMPISAILETIRADLGISVSTAMRCFIGCSFVHRPT